MTKHLSLSKDTSQRYNKYPIKIIEVQVELGLQILIFLVKCGMYRVPALYRFVPRLVKFEDANLKKKLINYWILKIWIRGGTRYVPHCS